MVIKPLDEEAIFKVAASIPRAEARSDYLAQVCGEDNALLQRVQLLLQADDEATQFLESPAAGTVPTLATEMIPVRQQDSIGPYKIREKIAEGGMGAVYVAEQTEPVRRKVALKVIRPGLAGPNVVARFEAERQALAMMDHPNIARVLDGGATDDQLPYFVMELVQGLPITEFCDQKRLTTDQRMKLFVDVCHAVQHAHQKGIIHRDLKPSNIMVAEIDGKAVPKVIDFGVAKALHQRLTDQTVYTQFSTMVGTPLYMSPEQAGLGVIDVDTRSDVYSLGVVLYELLTGETPYDRESLKRVTFDEMRRIIREEEPRRPSAMVSTLAAQQRSTVSERRGIDPRKLGDSLRGELDWLVMKALEKNRDRRYESASALAADIERYLNNEPVEACPPSVSYRIKKFAAKHKGLLTSAALLAVMLLLSTVVSANFAVQAGQERSKAVAAREQSEENFTAALDAIDKLLEHASSPELAEVPQVQPIRKKILEDVLAFYEGFRANTGDSPQIRFRAGQTWRSLGSLAKEIEEKKLAEQSFLQAIAFAESLTSEVAGNRDYQLLHLGSLGSLGSFCLHNLKNTERAERVYQQELQLMDQFLQAEPQDRDFWSHQKMFAYRHLADVARHQAEYDKAVEYVSKAEELAEELNDTDPWSEYGRQSSLAVNHEISNPELADKSYRRSVELGRKLMEQSTTRQKRHVYGSYLLQCFNFYQKRDPSFANEIASDIINIYRELTADFPNALVYQRHLDEAIRRQMQLIDSGEVEGVSSETLVNRYLRDFPQSPAVHLENAKRLAARSESPQTALSQAVASHPNQMAYRIARGDLLAKQEEMEQALADLQVVLDNSENASETANELANTARSLCKSERFEDALTIAQFIQEHGGDNYNIDTALCEATFGLGRYSEALDHINRAIDRAPRQWWLYKRRARTNFALGNYEEAIADLNTAYDGGQTTDDIGSWLWPSSVLECDDEGYRQGYFELIERAYHEHPKDPKFLILHGTMKILTGDLETAKQDHRAARAIEPERYASPPSIYIHCLMALDRVEDAIALLSDAIAESPQNGRNYLDRASLHLQRNHFNEARRDLQTAIKLGDKRFSVYYNTALLAASVPEGEDYSDICRQMIDQFQATEEPLEAHFTAWTCSLAPGAVEDYEPVIGLARRAVEVERGKQQYLNGVGAALLRAGRYAEAKESLEAALRVGDDANTSPSYIRYFLAMAEHHLGNSETAQQLLTQANESAAQELAASSAWNRKLTLELLRREAEALVSIDEK